MRVLSIAALTLFAGIFLNACTKDIDLPIPESTPRLVMNGVIDPDSIFILNLSSSVSAKSGNLPSYVNDGTVQVYENGSLIKTLKLNNLIYQNPWGSAVEGNYLDSSFTPVPGHSYEMRALKSGFSDVIARVQIPLSVRCDTSKVQNLMLASPGGFGGSQTNPGTSLNLKLMDQDLTTKNYYVIKVVQFDSMSTGKFETGLGTNNLSLQDFNGLQGSTESANQLYLTDDLFSQGTFNSEVHFFRYDGGFSNVTYFLDVITVTKDYFYYLQSLDSYTNANGNPFAEPAQLFSNVENGYGMIGGQVVKRFRLPQ